MVEILESQVKLVKDLEIVKIKELSSKCKVTFKYNNMEVTEELQKTCTPHYEIELCRKCINGAISSMYINVDNLVEAKKWLDGEVWKYIDKNNKEEERYVTLLKACRDLLNKCNDSCYVLDVMTETVKYDGAECDGSCLLEDINIYLEEIGE